METNTMLQERNMNASWALFQTISNVDTNEKRELIKSIFEIVFNYCNINFHLFDYFTMLKLKELDIGKETIDYNLNKTVNCLFSNRTRIFLRTLYNMISSTQIKSIAELYDYIFLKLQTMLSDQSSTIIFDLILFPDFDDQLKKRYPIVETITAAYQRFSPTVVTDSLFAGSTIIGKLIQENNQDKAIPYVYKLLNGQELNIKNVTMIGGGGSNLVFKIGKFVLKLGETRHNRSIYVNHRILASQVRKLILDGQGNDLFYVEIMRFINSEGVTLEEMNELKKDLYEQGLVWDDAKLENCGILDTDDDNISFLPVDYVDVKGIIENKIRREDFQKRHRRVVVLDNDCIRYNPLKSSR